jgi:hydroxymethylbilane synthase
MPYDGGLRLLGLVASPDGRRAVRGDLTGSGHEPETLGAELAGKLLKQGADSLLALVPSAS